MLKLFFTYYGGKWRISKRYPAPTNETIIEPFAGSAGYSLHYFTQKIKLYDVDPIICGVWNYLIKSTPDEIMTLPLIFESVNDLKIPQEAKWLIGFWLYKASAQPAKQPSKWMRSKIRPNSFWGESIRYRIASQIQNIKHWTIEQKSYEDIDNEKATWFIDPPYHKSGKYYKFNKINYVHLSDWCKSRNGQVMVCEQNGADWLPFNLFYKSKTIKNQETEVLWKNG